MLLAFLKNAGVPKNANKNFSKKRYKRKGGQGDAPLGVPPPLGERGGHSHILKQQDFFREKIRWISASRPYQKQRLFSVLFF
jgi:hypothetical protein